VGVGDCYPPDLGRPQAGTGSPAGSAIGARLVSSAGEPFDAGRTALAGGVSASPSENQQTELSGGDGKSGNRVLERRA
jgi:hypothetical protein